MTQSSSSRVSIAAVLLAALIGPLAGCQVAMSALTGLGSHPSQPAAQPVEPESTASSPSDGPTSSAADDDAATDDPEPTGGQPDREPPQQVVYEAPRPPPPPECHVTGRGEICDGVCYDVQYTDDHCGACWIKCHEGNHCDYSQCKRPDGAPQ